MPDFVSLSKQRAGHRFEGAPRAVIESTGAVVNCIVWQDSAESVDDMDNQVIEEVTQLNFLKSQISGSLKIDEIVRMEDGTAYRIAGAPDRDRDHEIRFNVRRV